MNGDELDRVQADLATMKSVCVEPALPTEEVLVDLIVGFCGLLLATVPWFVPVAWFKTGALVTTMIGGVYIPWKRRILKRDAVRRQLDSQEIKISVIALLGLFAYLLFRRIFAPDAEGWRHIGAAAIFFVGLGMLAYGLVCRTRRFRVVPVLVLMVGSLFMPLARSAPATYSILGVVVTLTCAADAVLLTWQSRRNMREFAS